jgi:hypothetical protein
MSNLGFELWWAGGTTTLLTTQHQVGSQESLSVLQVSYASVQNICTDSSMGIQYCHDSFPYIFCELDCFPYLVYTITRKESLLSHETPQLDGSPDEKHT